MVRGVRVGRQTHVPLEGEGVEVADPEVLGGKLEEKVHLMLLAVALGQELGDLRTRKGRQ